MMVLATPAAAVGQSVSYAPANGRKGVNPDTHLSITFPSPPAIGNVGTVRIYDAADDRLVDTLDLSIPPGPTAGPGATGGRVPYTPVPYEVHAGPACDQRRHGSRHAVRGRGANAGDFAVDDHRWLHRRVSLLSGDRPRQHGDDLSASQPADLRPELLRADDPGVLALPGGGFTGMTGKRGWTFSTKAAAPPANTARVVVAADGSGDFNTVQGALDFVPDRSPRRVTIFIRNGDYEEIVYCRNKSNLTILGESREGVQVHYANNEIFNPHPPNIATNEWPGTFPSGAPRSWRTRRSTCIWST